MNQKQLACVLLKILGLSICLQSIPSLIQTFFALVSMGEGPSPTRIWMYPAASVIPLIIGFYLLYNSREVAEKMFREEE